MDIEIRFGDFAARRLMLLADATRAGYSTGGHIRQRDHYLS
jgi:hypothetical protein